MAATYGLGFGLSLFLQPWLTSNLIGNGDFIQLFNLVQSLVLFVFNPVIVFFVFYKLGPKIPVQSISDHFRVLRDSFLGGLAGYAVGYLGPIAYEAIAYGSNAFGPDTNWFVWSAQLILSFVRGGIGIAFLAFVGVIIGRLRSTIPHTNKGTVESTTPS